MRIVRCDLGRLAAAIAQSQITVPEPRAPLPLLPDGFDEVDLAILVWIAGESRRFSPGTARN
jgi:hypothetical protein